MSGRTRRSGAALQRRFSAQEGAIAMMTAVLMVVLLGITALAYDLAHLRHQRQVLQDAVDLAAIAGAQLMPVQGQPAADLAVAEAQLIAHANIPGLPIGNLNITFRCAVSDPESNGGQDSVDLTFACGPAVAGSWSSGWTTKRHRATHVCDPYAGDLCNTIVVSASDTVQFYFAPVMGFNQGSTGSLTAASCRGFCGQPSTPLDVVVVLDRTASMTQADIDNAKAGANAVLDVYDPAFQFVGLVGLPYGEPANPCDVNDPQNYPQLTTGLWEMAPISGNYPALRATIACLVRTGNPVINPPGGSGHTDLGDPMKAAMNMLATEGRVGVPDVIIFMTDGQANQPWQFQPCQYAVDAANTAKANQVSVYTLGYGIGAVRCDADNASSYTGVFATTSLADMAGGPAGPISVDESPGSCPIDPVTGTAFENNDGDNYFCEAGTQNVEDVFRLIAIQTLKHSRLVDI